jgi:DNA-directed RNA polymerase subunit K/omega
MGFSDIALKEISEGKLSYELAEEEVEAVPEVIPEHDGITPARF